MSTLKLSGSTGGAGNFTVTPPAGAAVDRTLTLPDSSGTTALTSMLGLRNKIINGNPLINQRAAAAASTAYAAGVYFLDRWKAGAGGATLSFSTTDNVVTISITAGSIIQVVEGLNLTTGTYTLSWTGTAQGKIGAGAFSASGVTGSITGGTNTNVEFNVGTLSLVQLEPGSVATPFEHRPYGQELALCQRYYEKSFRQGTAPVQGVGTFEGAACIFIAGKAGTAPQFSSQVSFAVRKRTDATITLFNPVNTNAQARDETAGGDCSSTVAGGTGDGAFYVQCAGNAATAVGNLIGAHWTASAEL